MRAGFTDPQGRKLWRVVPYVLPTLALLFALFGPIEGAANTIAGFSAYGLLHLIAALDLRQRKPRTAEIECGPGYVDIKKAGTRNQRIAAQDISGATTARTSSGLLLTLQHRKRTAPITLEVATDAEAEKVRHALGIGHGGFGEIAWRTQSDPTQRSALIARILAILGAASIALAVGTGEGTAIGFAILFGMFGFIGSIISFVAGASPAPQPTVVMTAAGIRLKTPFGWFSLPYEHLRDVEDYRSRLAFTVPEPYNVVFVDTSSTVVGGPSAHEREITAAQLRAAAQRARGMGPHKTDVTGRVDVLRRNGETARNWLERLDMAGQMLAAGSGYRGNTLDADDLWAILEDPEAEPEMRAAAARVLRHSPKPETRVRIDTAFAAVRDEMTNRRLRIAVLDDVDNASQALAFLDAEERLNHNASAQMRVMR